MLYYERIVQPGVYLSPSPRSSEETLKPRMNGSSASLQSVATEVSQATVKAEESVVEIRKLASPIPQRVPGARIVRNVSTQRSRSASVSPPSQSSVLSSGLPHPLASVVVEKRDDSKPLQNGDASHHHSKPKSSGSVPGSTTSPSSSPKKKSRSKASASTSHSHPEHDTPPTELRTMSSSVVGSSSQRQRTSSSSSSPSRHRSHQTKSSTSRTVPDLQA